VLRGCLFASAVTTPIVTKLGQENGLTHSYWLILQALFNVTMLSVDLPTGYFADRVSRKLSLCIGGICLVAGSIFYGLSTDFWSMLLAECALAVGFGFCSGADHALIYESLLELDEPEEYDRLVPKLNAVEILSAGVFAVSGGLLAGFHLRAPFILEVLVFSTFLFVASRFEETHRAPKESRLSFLGALKRSALLREHPSRLDLQLGMSALCFAGLQTYLWYYQLLFDQHGVPISWNGVIFFGFHLIAAGSARTSPWLERKLGGYPWVLFAPLITAVLAFFTVGVISAPWILGALVLTQLARGWNGSLLTAELNRNLPTEVRATILSLRSFLNRAVYVVFLLCGSAASTVYGVQDALLIIGGLLATGALLLWLKLRVALR